MIRFSISERPEAWHDIEVVIEGEAAPMRAKYWLLKKREAADWSRKRLELARAIRTENEAETFSKLIDELSPEQFATVDALLRERILDWDLQDSDGEPLPISDSTLAIVLDQARFWRPLFQGLIDASSNVAAKKTA